MTSVQCVKLLVWLAALTLASAGRASTLDSFALSPGLSNRSQATAERVEDAAAAGHSPAGGVLEEPLVLAGFSELERSALLQRSSMTRADFLKDVLARGANHPKEGERERDCDSALAVAKTLLDENRHWEFMMYLVVTLLGLAVLAFVSAWLGANLHPRPPSYWLNKPWNPFTDDFEAEVDVTEQLKDTMQELLDMTTKREAMGVGRDGRWATHKGFRVIKVSRIENGHLWTRYAQYRTMMKPVEKVVELMPEFMKMRTQEALKKIEEVHSSRNENTLVAEFLASLGLDDTVNERMMFHGSPAMGARSGSGEVLFATEEASPRYAIKTVGFDDRLGSVKGMYGSGTYFADMASKADQYAGRYNEQGHPNGTVGEIASMFLARVSLGCPYQTNQSLEQLRRPPCVEGHFDLNLSFNEEVVFGKPWRQKGVPFTICRHSRFDSVMGDLTIDGKEKLYREFVVYGQQAYPEFSIQYERLP
eukprot:TRINITY_DN91426_c0_g1_i1.p1 TRINITY_DN91426_c0_g1~~TRINITY_DN91426_c0_g1_i1.p1  ORF type:complete len:477 (+),score=121.18 TRINITY_DN91426_c0_g1_i1:112-1542(+)